MMYRADYRAAVLKKREAEQREAAREAREAELKAKKRHAAALMVVPAEVKVPVRQIIESVAAKHGLTYNDIVGRSRRVDIVAARKEAMKMAHNLRPDMSMTALGRQFKRDHTTLLSALGRLSRCKK